MTLKRGSVAVVGAAESDLGQVAPHTSPVDLMAQATLRALDDCGLKLSDIDGVFSAATQVRTAPMTLAEYLRIKPGYFDGDCTRVMQDPFKKTALDLEFKLLENGHFVFKQVREFHAK